MNDAEIKETLRITLVNAGNSPGAVRALLKPHFKHTDTDDEEFDAIVGGDENRRSTIIRGIKRNDNK